MKISLTKIFDHFNLLATTITPTMISGMLVELRKDFIQTVILSVPFSYIDTIITQDTRIKWDYQGPRKLVLLRKISTTNKDTTSYLGVFLVEHSLERPRKTKVKVSQSGIFLFLGKFHL